MRLFLMLEALKGEVRKKDSVEKQAVYRSWGMGNGENEIILPMKGQTRNRNVYSKACTNKAEPVVCAEG